MRQEEFLALQEEWDRRLRAEGLEYIDTYINIKNRKNLRFVVHKNDAAYFLLYKQSLYPKSKIDEEYFSLIRRIIDSTWVKFKKDTHRYIMHRWADGALIKTIVKELAIANTPVHRHSVRFIIRRYEQLWKIRSYSPRQLNIKQPKNPTPHIAS